MSEIKDYPMYFRDGLDKHLYKKHGIMGGCSSIISALEYNLGRQVGSTVIDLVFKRILQENDSSEIKEMCEKIKKELIN